MNIHSLFGDHITGLWLVTGQISLNHGFFDIRGENKIIWTIHTHHTKHTCKTRSRLITLHKRLITHNTIMTQIDHIQKYVEVEAGVRAKVSLWTIYASFNTSKTNHNKYYKWGRRKMEGWGNHSQTTSPTPSLRFLVTTEWQHKQAAYNEISKA